jgi:hypothetical protein
MRDDHRMQPPRSQAAQKPDHRDDEQSRGR